MTTRRQTTIELPSRREKAIPRRKLLFAEKLKSLLDEYDTCLIIDISNIGSNQIAEMRKEFNNKARFLFGKNTLIRKILRDYIKESKNKKLMYLMDLIKGNCGLVFTKETEINKINIIRKRLIENKKQCAAKLNAIAPVDVYVPVGPTNMEPTKTSMFQSMDISTRINHGQIDVIEAKHIITKGEKVNASSALLLSELNMKPFCYGIKVKSIYNDGEVIKDTSFMDMSIDDIAQSFYNGVRQVAAFCVSLKYPTIISVPHSIINAYKQTTGLSLMLDTYSWNGLNEIKSIIQYYQQVVGINNDNDNNIDDGGTLDNNDDGSDNGSNSTSSICNGIFIEEDSSSSSSSEE